MPHCDACDVYWDKLIVCGGCRFPLLLPLMPEGRLKGRPQAQLPTVVQATALFGNNDFLHLNIGRLCDPRRHLGLFISLSFVLLLLRSIVSAPRCLECTFTLSGTVEVGTTRCAALSYQEVYGKSLLLVLIALTISSLMIPPCYPPSGRRQRLGLGRWCLVVKLSLRRCHTNEAVSLPAVFFSFLFFHLFLFSSESVSGDCSEPMSGKQSK